MEFRFLEPLPHPPERLPAGLQLGPGLGVAEQVGQRALRPAEHALREYRLWYAVPFQLGADSLRQLLGVDLLHVGTGAVRRRHGHRRILHEHRRLGLDQRSGGLLVLLLVQQLDPLRMVRRRGRRRADHHLLGLNGMDDQGRRVPG